MNNLHHPAITAIERYGYPKPQKVIHQCSWCGEPIYDGEDCYDMRPYGYCCECCLNDRLMVAGEYDG